MKRCCNIDRSGRVFRLAIGLILLGNAIGLAWLGIPSAGLMSYIFHALLGLTGIFCLYEAAMGWCLLRALGYSTRI